MSRSRGTDEGDAPRFMTASLSTVGITLGDVTGVGPEVVAKALATELPADPTRYALVGDAAVLERLRSAIPALSSAWEVLDRGLAEGRLRWIQPLAEPLPPNLPAGDPRAAQAALAWLREGAKRCLAGELAALVTAPLSKESVIRSGELFVGQTEFLSELTKTSRTAMMLLGQGSDGRWLRVALATNHVPLRQVADRLSLEKIREVIDLTAEACADLGLTRARIAVCGLNPHAGEGGKMGDEELRIVGPAVRAARAAGRDVVGPLAGDTVFHAAYQGEFDAVVAMYHDQGLAPLKVVAFETGVNWTLGLPFIRTSPDHGTAFDIAGRGVASPSSTQAAIRLARQLARTRRAQRRQTSAATTNGRARSPQRAEGK